MHSPGATAIVIIDAQKDFADPAFAYGKRHPVQEDIAAVAERLNILAHQKISVPLLAVRSDYFPHQFGENLSVCIPGTGGHQSILPSNNGIIEFAKKEHSCFSSGGFAEYLEQQQLKHLLLCGFLTEYCVKETALDALSKGYQVTLCPELIGSADDKQAIKKGTFALLKASGAFIECPGDLYGIPLHF
ncbi:isochorismatase family cysteine hydrolase [Niabella beijingensis]|uniref:isochorismatase family cysteine hydrolase n=1 Tax=Niabella beijingensis TaxID=2872700 RepID=UPI001CC08944|nr:isochorismatase family cysteine hydrolase [Niabella beijingensis]MBZ4187262.1 cysteine hydrolase [Niabella beijingensis]